MAVANSWLGRTGRIGHRGVATSFFTERDEPLASVLTRTLLETNQDIPDFLQAYVPENWSNGSKVKFETESDFDPNDVAGAGGGETDGAEAGGWNGDDNGHGDSGSGWSGSRANDGAADGEAANSGDGWNQGASDANASGSTWGAGAAAQPAATSAW